MKTRFKHIFLAFLLTILYSVCSHAQSAVFIYKNEQSGKGDFMYIYGMPSVSDAEMLAFSKMLEQGYESTKVAKYVSTPNKGYGMVIRATVEIDGLNRTIYGAAVGCESYVEAEQQAMLNMKEYNPEWDSSSYIIIDKFLDE